MGAGLEDGANPRQTGHAAAVLAAQLDLAGRGIRPQLIRGRLVGVQEGPLAKGQPARSATTAVDVVHGPRELFDGNGGIRGGVDKAQAKFPHSGVRIAPDRLEVDLGQLTAGRFAIVVWMGGISGRPRGLDVCVVAGYDGDDEADRAIAHDANV